MSHHQHQLVPDHSILPYAWHYKCSVEGCDYETDSFEIPDDTKDTEIARLRARLSEIEMTCEQHSWLVWPHEGCAGPGMPMQNSLDRFQKAEAVVRAAEVILNGHTPIHWYVDIRPLEQALAAYRERA